MNTCMFLRRLKGQHQPGGEGLHPAAQDLGQDVQGLRPGAVSGDYLGYPGLPQPVGEGPDPVSYTHLKVGRKDEIEVQPAPWIFSGQAGQE